MKKIFSLTVLILIFTFHLIGCSNMISSKLKSDIREKAYNWLDNKNQSSIIDWKNASVEEVEFNENYTINTKADSVNIKNIKAYKVTFDTTDKELLGPIVVYLNKDNIDVLGIDYRE